MHHIPWIEKRIRTFIMGYPYSSEQLEDNYDETGYVFKGSEE